MPPDVAPRFRLPCRRTLGAVLHGVRLEDTAHTPFPVPTDAITLEAADRIVVQGRLSAEMGGAGDAVVGARARLDAPRVRVEAAGDVTLGDRVRLDYGPFSPNEIVAGANLYGQHPSIVAGKRRTEIVAEPGGAVELASLPSKEDRLDVSGGSVTIGLPDPVTGRLARSAVTGRTTIDATGPVRLRSFRFTGPTFDWVTVDALRPRAELRQRHLVVHLRERDLDRHPDAQVFIRAVDDVGVEANALLQLDDRDVVGRVREEARMLRAVDDDERPDRPAARQRRPRVLLREALRADDARREAQMSAGGAALDGELPAAGVLPVGRAVLGDRGQRLVDLEHQSAPCSGAACAASVPR
jgi:hypothetical protein